MGDLLEELEKAKNQHDAERLAASRKSPEVVQGAAPHPALSPRQEAIADAGISPDQAKRAQAVSRFAKAEPERFEAMVEAR